MTDMVPPPHPADFLNDVLMPATGRSDSEIAHLLGISPQLFYKMLTREAPITRQTAVLLGRLFQTGVEFWVKMQTAYDTYAASQRVIERDIVVLSAPVLAAPEFHEMPRLRARKVDLAIFRMDAETAMEIVPQDERMGSVQ